jgi:hypothetical protein
MHGRTAREHHLLPRLTLAYGILLVTACDILTGRVCTDEAVSGINVRVRDSVSDRPAGFGTTVLAKDGAYVESLTFSGAIDSMTFFGAFERPGRYTVEVTNPEYHPWRRTDLTVKNGPCHVVPVSVEARLQQLP